MQPILVDRGQLVPERLVEQLDDLGVALHAGPPVWRRPYACARRQGSAKMAENWKIFAIESQSQVHSGGAGVDVEQLARSSAISSSA